MELREYYAEFQHATLFHIAEWPFSWGTQQSSFFFRTLNRNLWNKLPRDQVPYNSSSVYIYLKPSSEKLMNTFLRHHYYVVTLLLFPEELLLSHKQEAATRWKTLAALEWCHRRICLGLHLTGAHMGTVSAPAEMISQSLQQSITEICTWKSQPPHEHATIPIRRAMEYLAGVLVWEGAE